jgi:hypothetical protein
MSIALKEMSESALIESLILRDCGRRIEFLAPHVVGELDRITQQMLRASGVAVVTGFAVPTPTGPLPETDGPIGSASLATFFHRRGLPALILTDAANGAACEAALSAYTDEKLVRIVAAADIEQTAAHLREIGISHLVFVERLGPNASGNYMSMAAVDMTHVTTPLEQLAPGFATVGVGDGGNEIGMGRLPHQAVASAIKNGEIIHCVAETDHLLLAGVSNWGAWGIVAAAASGDPAAKDAAEEALSVDAWRESLARCVDAGAVDGVLLQSALSVDGMSVDIHDSMLIALRSCMRPLNAER